MAIKEVKRYWESCQLDYVKEFLCHTEKDVEQLPACCVGSKAYVNETGNWYACGKDQVWKLEEEATEEGGGNTGTGTGLPSDVGPYKQMATDGEGNWVPEDKECYAYEVLSFDGNIDGVETVDVQEIPYVKISDKILTADDLVGQTMIVAGWKELGSPIVPSKYVITADDLTVGEDTVLLSVGGVPQIISTNILDVQMSETETITFPSVGTYCMYVPAGFLPFVTSPIYLEFVGTLKELNTVCLPEIPVNKLPEIPVDKVQEYHKPIITTKTFEWDGSTDGRDTFVRNGFNYYKVSDFAPLFADVVSAETTKNTGSTSSDFYGGSNCYACGFSIVVENAGSCTLAVTEGGSNQTFEAPSAGLYFEVVNNKYFTKNAQITYAEKYGADLCIWANATEAYKITVDSSGSLVAEKVGGDGK